MAGNRVSDCLGNAGDGREIYGDDRDYGDYGDDRDYRDYGDDVTTVTTAMTPIDPSPPGYRKCQQRT